jgi:hypothetical protein
MIEHPEHSVHVRDPLVDARSDIPFPVGSVISDATERTPNLAQDFARHGTEAQSHSQVAGLLRGAHVLQCPNQLTNRFVQIFVAFDYHR